MKKLLYVLSYLLISNTSLAQDKEVIRQQALIVAHAAINNDYITIIKYSHPNLIANIGGREVMLNAVKKGMENMKMQGVSIDTVVVGTPGEIFKAGNELHCLVPEGIVMSAPNGKLIAKSHLLAISGDNGLNWTFINLSDDINNETITQLLPNFNRSLVLPEETKPVFYKNQ